MRSNTSQEHGAEVVEDLDDTTVGSGAVYVDTVTIELTTGTDLLARPYRHSVSGRHMMLAQAGTLWKATRSAREKDFYALVAAAAKQHGVPAGERGPSTEPGTLTAADGDGGPGSPLSRVPESEREMYTAAVSALLPFLARYDGTRNVAHLKVGSAGFAKKCVEARSGNGGGVSGAESTGSSAAAAATATFVPRMGSASALADGSPSQGSLPTVSWNSNAGGGGHENSCVSPWQTSVPARRTPPNASRVVLQTDAVKQAVAQFAKDKKEAIAERRRLVAGGNTPTATVTATGRAAVVVCKGSISDPNTPTNASAEEIRNENGAAVLRKSGSPPPRGCGVVAVATAQIEEELNRRLPPRQADRRGSASTTNPSTLATTTTGVDASATLSLAAATGAGLGTSFASANVIAKEASQSSSATVACTNTATNGEQSDGWVEMIVLEDVCSRFRKPCVLDVKMGTRQYGMHTKPEKIQEKEYKAKISTSARYGIRLAGFKRWSASRQTYDVRTKHDLFTLTFNEVAATLRYFLSSYQPPGAAAAAAAAAAWTATSTSNANTPAVPGFCPASPTSRNETDMHALTDADRIKEDINTAVRGTLAEQLARLLAAFRAQSVFRFFTSSLLIVYDAADPVHTCRVVMVDFAYAYEWKELIAEQDMDCNQKTDEGYIRGIESLLEALRDPI